MSKFRFFIAIGMFLFFSLIIASTNSQIAQKIILIEERNYSVLETVTIYLNYTELSDSRLDVYAPDKKYSLIDPKPVLRFIPKQTGIYTLELIKGNTALDSSSFLVYDSEKPNRSSGKANIAVDKQVYSLGERVIIVIDSSEDLSVFNLEISTNGKTYRAFNLNKRITYVPQIPGQYKISLIKNDFVYGETFFYVEGAKQEQVIPPENLESLNDSLTEDSSQQKNEPAFTNYQTSFRIKDRKGNNINFDSLAAEDSQKPGKFRNKFKFNTGKIKEIEFNNLQFLENSTLRVDLLEKKFEIDGKKSLSTYAIDPSQLSFDNATVTVTATGTELWKCRDWNFNQQTCLGSWVKMQDLTPGENYAFLLDSQDPGFAETGVATVNTKKPIYHPGEKAELIMVVLNRLGYPANADVSLTIVKPNNSTSVIDSSSINNPRRGIYETSFDDTWQTGKYTLFVNAIGENVNSNLTSYFEVKEFYEFDISRDTSFIIDPWREPVRSQIKINSYTYGGKFSFTEVLPGSFEVLNYGNAVKSYQNNSILLTWNNLRNGSTVEYLAYAPEKSPDLYEVSSYVSYDGIVFKEARPWFIAIDPRAYSGIFVYKDTINPNIIKYRIWNSSTMSVGGEVNGPNVGSPPAWQKIRCMEQRPECLWIGNEFDTTLDFSIYYESTDSWSGVTNLGTTDDDYMMFDVECEGIRGDCLVVYEKNLAADNTFYYRIYNATSGTLENEVSVNTPNATNNAFRWIKLYPKYNENTIAVLLQNLQALGGEYEVGIWNGTTFTNWQELHNLSSDINYRTADCAWEGASGDLICFYTRNAENGIHAWAWNASANLWINYTEVWAAADVGNEPMNLETCGESPITGDITHNKLILIASDAGADRLGSYWNDSYIVTTADPTQVGNTEWVRDDTAVCSWEHDGNTAVIMWVDTGSLTPEWGTFNAQDESFDFATWGVGSTTGSTTWADDVESLELSLNPENDEMLVTGHSLISVTAPSSEVECTRWNGTSFDATGCGNIETTGATDGAGSREFFGYTSVDWSRYNAQPNVTTLAYPGNNTNLTTHSINFTFTVGDDLGIKNCSIYINTSTWSSIASSVSINNGQPSNITYESLGDGRYTWNALCYDISLPPKSDWYDYNYTFTLDFNPPNVTELSFTPNPQLINLPVNITARLSDFIGIKSVVAHVTLPNLSDYNLTMTSSSGGIYYVLFNSTTPTGQYDVTIIANDTFGNLNNTVISSFNVTLENISLTTDKSRYTRLETAYFYSKGFNASVNVSIYLYDPTGDPIFGYPKNLTSNSTGGINDSWEISGVAVLGLYSLNATETVEISRSINWSFEVLSAIIDTDKTTYEQGEFLNITGSSWNPNVNVTINITDSNNVLAFGPLNLSSDSGGIINYTWFVPYNETTGTHLLFGYEPLTPAKKDDSPFTVTARTITLETQFPWYRIGERVNITGSGFSIPSNVTILVYNSGGTPILGYPKNVSVNSTGRINDSFLISNLPLGTYFINTTDVKYPNLKKTYNFSIVRPILSLDKEIYTSGETVYLTGSYWDRLVNVTINLINETGLSEPGYPLNVSSNSTGGFSYLFTARADLPTILYNLSANQSYDSARNATTNFTVIRLASLPSLRYYYVQLELVNISGRSYTANDNVSIWVKNKDNGGNAFYYPQNNLTNSNGDFTHYFNISNYCEGNYTVIATDEENPSLSNLTFDFGVRGWWNSSWKKRKPIYLTNYLSSNRNDERVFINITGLSGNITNCVNETRIISTLSGQEVTLNVINGDNSTYCEVSFLANMTTSYTNESIYYVYYNNSLAKNPNYPVLPLYSYYILYEGFESGSDFLYTATTCPIDSTRECVDSSPWGDFTNCIETDGPAAYGICSSDYAAFVGSRGFMSNAGLDRNTAGNALYATVNKSTCGDLDCNYINISYYQAAALLEVAAPVEGSGVFVNDSDGTLRLISDCLNAEACENGASADMRGFQEYVSAQICSIVGINCSEQLTVMFTSANIRTHTSGDYFGWDEINITGYRNYAGNVTPLTGDMQEYFECQNIDVTAPNVVINTPMNSSNTSDISPEINFTITDDFDGILNYSVFIDWVYSTINGTSINNTLKSINSTNLTEGRHVIVIEVKDDYSNARNSTSWNITVDISGPLTNITDPVNFTNTSALSYLLKASSYDNLTEPDSVTFLYRPNNLAAWTFACKDARAPLQCSWDISLLADGNSYEIRAYTNDTLNNIGPNFTTYNFTIDRTGPLTNITDPINFTNINTTAYLIIANVTDVYSRVDSVTFIYRKNSTASWSQICADSVHPYECSLDTTALVEGNTHQLRAYANDSLGNLGGNFTVGNLSINMFPPIFNEVLATPAVQKLGLPINITSNITDQTGIAYTEAIIIMPNSTHFNILMTDGDLNSLFNSTFLNTYIIGQYNITVFANDTFGNYNTSEMIPFILEYEDLFVSTDKPQYVREEIVYISGKGFGSFNNVTVNIYNSSGDSLLGFPHDEFINATGGVNDSWTIPLVQDLGTYTLNITDKNDINRTINTTFDIVTALVFTNKQSYEQAEFINITGQYWDPNEIVELNITDFNGELVFGPYQVTSNSTGGIYSNWTSAYNATLGSYLLSAVEPNNPNKYDTEIFTITQRSVFVMTDYSWYKDGYTVYITGFGFSNYSNVSLDIYNESGYSISGYPKNITSNSTGAINNSFTIVNLLSENYTINATDLLYPNLNDYIVFEIVASTLSTDKSSYVNGDIVYITGSSWTRDANITIDIKNVSNRSITGYPKNISSNSYGQISDSLTATSIGLGSTFYNITTYNPLDTRENITIGFTVVRMAVVSVNDPRPDVNQVINITGTYFSQSGPITLMIRYANSTGYVNYFPVKINSNPEGNISYNFNTTDMCKGNYAVEAADDTISSLYGNTSFNVTHLNANSSVETTDENSQTGTYNILGGTVADISASDNVWQYFGGADYNSNFSAHINYTLNLTTMNPYNVSNVTFTIEYCHSGVQANSKCNQGFPHEGTTNNPQRIDLYNFSNNQWVNISVLPVNDISDNEQTVSFSFDKNPMDFIQNRKMHIRLNVNFSQLGFSDDVLVIDYLSANFTYASEVNKPCVLLGSTFITVNNYNKSLSLFSRANISILNGTTVLVSGNGSFMKYIPSGDNLNVRVDIPLSSDNVSYKIYGLSYTQPLTIKSIVDENYSYTYPQYTLNTTPFLVLNDTLLSYTKTEVMLPKRGREVNTLLHCLNYNYSNNQCLNFEINDTYDYEFNEDSNYLYFNVTSFDSFGGGVGVSIPNVTNISIYNVTGLSDPRKGGTLISNSLNTTFNFSAGEMYRIQFRIYNSGSRWDIVAADVAYQSGLNQTWRINTTHNIWYTDSASPNTNRSGGNFTNGRVVWNTSQAGRIAAARVGNFYYVVNITTNRSETYPVYFLINDTSTKGGSYDYSNYRIFDVLKPFIILNQPYVEDNVSYGNVLFNWTPMDNTYLNNTCDLIINGAINMSGISSPNAQPKTVYVSITASGRYNWSVNCTDYDRNFNISETRNFTIIVGPVYITINLTSANNSMRLNWSSSAFAESYNVYITANYSQGFSSTPNATGITDLNWTDNNAFESQRRYYKIGAVKGSSVANSQETAGKQTMQLYLNWNLFSIPFNITNWLLYDGSNGRDIFTNPGDCIITLWRYNASNQSYQRTDYVSRVWQPGSESFTSLEPGQGYWAEVNQNCNLTLFGIVPRENSTFALKQYWDLMGHYSSKDPLLGDESIMKPIDVTPADSVEAITKYNPLSNSFEVTVHYPSGIWWPSYNDQDFLYLSPMTGYYFDVNQQANWNHDPTKG